MPQVLDYHQAGRATGDFPWYKTDAGLAAIPVLIIIAANTWLVWNADKGFGFALWVFFLIPLANMVLAGLLVAICPLVRRISGASASLHVNISLLGCLVAVFVDGGIILSMLYGC